MMDNCELLSGNTLVEGRRRRPARSVLHGIWMVCSLVYLMLPSRTFEKAVYAQKLRFASIGIHVVDFGIILLCFATIIIMPVEKRALKLNSSVVILWGIILFAPVISSLLSPSTEAYRLVSYSLLDAMVTFLFVILCSLYVASYETSNELIQVIILGGILLFIVSCMPSYLADTPTKYLGRARSIGLGPNAFGLYGVFMTALSCSALMFDEQCRGWRRIYMVVAVLFGMMTVIRSGSRMSLAGLVGSMSYLVIRNIGRKASFSRRATRTMGTMLILGTMLIVATAFLPETVLNRFDIDRLVLSESDRIPLWRKALEMMFERPVLGWGTGVYFAEVGVEHPHNLFLELAVEAGLLGAMGFTAMVWGTVKKPIRGCWQTAAAKSGLVGFFIDSMGDNLLTSAKIQFVVIILMCLAWRTRRGNVYADNVL